MTELRDRLDGLFEDAVARGVTAGLVVVVTDGSDTVYQHGAGVLRAGSASSPRSPTSSVGW